MRIRNNAGKGKDIEKFYVYLISPTGSTEEILPTLDGCPEATLTFHTLSPRSGDATAFPVSPVLSTHTPCSWLPQLSWFPLFSSPMCQSGPPSGRLAIVGKRGCLQWDYGNSWEGHPLTSQLLLAASTSQALSSPTLPSTPTTYIRIFLDPNLCFSSQTWA